MRDELTRIFQHFEAAGDKASRARAEARIWREHGRLAAVFVLDLSGFTRGVAMGGLVVHLAMINRLLLKTDPIIRSHGGRTIKHDADNCFAVFDDVAPAVAAAEACLVMLGRHGTSGGVGIAFGPILLAGNDFYGQPVNIACKLGEDVATAGEILVEEGAAAMLSDELRRVGSQRILSASGVEITAMVHWIPNS